MSEIRKNRLLEPPAIGALMLALILGHSIVSARPPDRKPPTAPTNLRVTGSTSYTVSLAWDPSTDNSGSFSYRVHHSSGYEASLPQTQTSFTWTGHLDAGGTYSFYVYAVDGAGNRSRDSNSVTATLPRDTTPPTKPVVSVTDVGPTWASLAWTASDDGPYIFYFVYKNAGPVAFGITETSFTPVLLEPGTNYSFTVQARDNGGNWSPMSDPVAVTTEPSDPNDTIPPTTPGNLTNNGMTFDDGETWLFWDESTDNVDPQFAIRYDVYVNGILDHSLAGAHRTIVYGTVGALNTFHVVAVDGARNQSAPATFTVQTP